MAKILIAEDEPDIRELIELSLGYGGYEVAAARDGQEAVEMALTDSYDLIMMDVRMPRMTGYEACRALKKRPEFSDIPIVFVSAKGQDKDIKEGMAAGATAYIVKPFEPEQLLQKVKEILAEASKPR
ncbi:MAG: response regulator [Ardenticatenaceae bacterium]|nr:response regulator [Ardenticatenaceae bacterium]